MVGAYAHLRDRRADRPRLEQLRAAPAPGEADSALHPQRARRRPAARLRRRHAGPQLALGRGLRARSTWCSSSARPARSTTSAARTSCQHRGREGDPELTGRDESLIEHVTDRLGHDRRYSLSSDRTEASAGSRGRLRRGIQRTVEWYRANEVVVGADPLGRVPRVLRAPLRLARSADGPAPRNRLDGLVLVEPEVYGDERGFLVETFSERGVG